MAWGTSDPKASATKALLLWAAVAFGLLNIGLPHEGLRAVQRAMDRGQRPGAVEAVRAYYTNDGDLWRYYAYAQAALGRPYPSYFVRTAEAWREAFASHEPYRPDELPVATPPRRLVPYRDFLVEYPPGFFLLALPLAGLLRGVRAFTLAFQCAMALALSLALLLAKRALPTDERNHRSLAAWAALAVLLLGVVSTHRYDAAVALVLALGAWALARERPILLGLAAAAAFALKGVPLIAFIPLTMVWIRERRYDLLTRFAAAALVGAAAIMVPVLWVAGAAALETARYHAARPPQLESTWGALMGFVHALRPDLVTVEKTFGSTNTTGRLASVFGPASTVATLLGLLAVYHRTWQRTRAPEALERHQAALEGMLASLALFMAFGKVCSPQFLVWLLPLGVALSLAMTSSGTLTLLLAIFALTQAVYPVSYGQLESLQPWAVSLVVGRNALLVAWAVILLRPHAIDGRARESSGTGRLP
jgi:hypothetical protein